VIERFVIMIQEEEIKASHLTLLVEPRESPSVPGIDESQPLNKARDNFEKEYIHRILLKHSWDIPKVASELKIEEGVLKEKIKSLGISFLG